MTIFQIKKGFGVQCGNWLSLYMNPVFKISFQFINLFSKLIHWKLLGKILHIFAASMGMLQMLPLILENSPFPYSIVIFLNKIILEITTFSIFFRTHRYRIESHFIADCFRWNFIFIKVLMTCFSYIHFFITG